MTSLSGVKVMLEGPAGTGKTYSIGTLVDWAAKNSVDVFVLAIEGLEALIGYWADRGKPIPENLFWSEMTLKHLTTAQLKDAAVKVGQLSFESLTKVSDSTRSQNNSLERILTACCNFKDDRTEKTFGSIDSWGADRVFVIDSLSELANAINKSVIGNKPTMNQGEYGLAQNQLMNFLRLCTQGCRCHFVLTAHVAREKNEITGGIKLMTRAIGSAIAGDIPPLFSDVIYTVREGASFFWDTASMEVDTKTRSLPIQAKIVPDFAQIMEKWKGRAALTKSSAGVTPAAP